MSVRIHFDFYFFLLFRPSVVRIGYDVRMKVVNVSFAGNAENMQ